MAVSNPQLPSLTPAYGNIQESLMQRAQMAREAPSSMSTMAAATGAVADIAEEERKRAHDINMVHLRSQLDEEARERQRDFEGRFDYAMRDEEDLDEVSNELQVPKEVLRPLMNVAFKDEEDATNTYVKRAILAKKRAIAELQGRDPNAREAVVVMDGQEVIVPVGAAEEALRIGDEAEANAVSIIGKEGGQKVNAEKIQNLQEEIDALNSMTATSSGTSNFQAKKYYDQTNKVWRWGSYNPSTGQTLMDPDSDPIAHVREQTFTVASTGERAKVTPTGAQALTGPTMETPKGQKATQWEQLNAKEKQYIIKGEENLNKNQLFKSSRNLEETVGQFKTMMDQDLESIRGALKSQAARAIAGEKGVLTERDVERVSGSSVITERWKRGIRSAVDGTMTEQEWKDFQDVSRTILMRAELMRNAAVRDAVEDATGPLGQLKRVDPQLLYERYQAPSAAALVSKEAAQYRLDDFKAAVSNLGELNQEPTMENIENMLKFMESKGKAQRKKQ